MIPAFADDPAGPVNRNLGPALREHSRNPSRQLHDVTSPLLASPPSCLLSTHLNLAVQYSPTFMSSRLPGRSIVHSWDWGLVHFVFIFIFYKNNHLSPCQQGSRTSGIPATIPTLNSLPTCYSKAPLPVTISFANNPAVPRYNSLRRPSIDVRPAAMDFYVLRGPSVDSYPAPTDVPQLSALPASCPTPTDVPLFCTPVLHPFPVTPPNCDGMGVVPSVGSKAKEILGGNLLAPYYSIHTRHPLSIGQHLATTPSHPHTTGDNISPPYHHVRTRNLTSTERQRLATTSPRTQTQIILYWTMTSHRHVATHTDANRPLLDNDVSPPCHHAPRHKSSSVGQQCRAAASPCVCTCVSCLLRRACKGLPIGKLSTIASPLCRLDPLSSLSS